MKESNAENSLEKNTYLRESADMEEASDHLQVQTFLLTFLKSG